MKNEIALGIPTSILIKKNKELMKFVSETEEEILVTIGAGDIGEMVDDIKEVLEKRRKK